MGAVTVYSFVSEMDCFLIMMDELEQMFNESGDSFHHQTSWHIFTSYIFLLLGRVNVFILSYLCGKEGAIYHLLFCFVIINYLPPCPHVITVTPELVLSFDCISLMGLFASHFQPR